MVGFARHVLSPRRCLPPYLPRYPHFATLLQSVADKRAEAASTRVVSSRITPPSPPPLPRYLAWTAQACVVYGGMPVAKCVSATMQDSERLRASAPPPRCPLTAYPPFLVCPHLCGGPALPCTSPVAARAGGCSSGRRGRPQASHAGPMLAAADIDGRERAPRGGPGGFATAMSPAPALC